jgi:hypothetical protein
MLKTIGIMAAAATLFAATTALGGPYLEQFNSNSAGWQAPTVNNGGGVTVPNAAFSLNGVYSGCISAPLSQGSDRLFDFQPADAGLFQGLTGLNLTVDYKIDGVVTGPSMPMVRFYVGTYSGGNNYFVSNDAFSWNPNADASWVTHQVELLSANFIRWPNQDSNNRTFDQVIAAPEDIGLTFCGNFTSNSTLGFSGSGTISIDNFGAVNNPGSNSSMIATPEPATVALLVFGGAWMFARRRRARR